MSKRAWFLTIAVFLIVSTAAIGVGLVFNYFGAPELYETGMNPIDVLIDDIDQDGIPDILTANRSGKSVSIFKGKGDGRFEPRVDLEVGTCSASIAVGDMNEDGLKDLIVGECVDGMISIYYQSEGLKFPNHQNLAAGGYPYNVLVKDFDLDGHLDIAASDYPNARIIVFHSQGNNRYSESPTYLSTGPKTIALFSEDLDSDGRPDLISSDHTGGASSIYLSAGGQSFSKAPEVKTGTLPYSISLGDLDEDGILDLAVAYSSQPGGVSIFRGLGHAQFKEVVRWQLDDPLLYVLLKDVDGDKHLDILLSHNEKNLISLYLGKGDGSFQRQEFLVASKNKVYSMDAADLNKDGCLDLVTIDYEGSTLWVAMGQFNKETGHCTGEFQPA